jgi:hypothetical protein
MPENRPIVRQFEYEVILQDLLRNGENRSIQHYLLCGRWGSGKSTLLKSLQAEIETNEDLKAAYIAIHPAEEQAGIYRLFDLLEELLRELEYRGLEVHWPEEADDQVYTQQLFFVIHQYLGKLKKKAVLLLDNIDRVLENLGPEAALLREHIQNFNDLKIIGGSTRVTEHFWAYHQPFYDFFRVLSLDPLNSTEVRNLVLNGVERFGVPGLKEFVENRPGQWETIRILTDGKPRTLQPFVDSLFSSHQETYYDYLKLAMDQATPLYREQLNHLPPSQRKIVLQMALYREAVGAKELARDTRIESRVISAHLSQLIDKEVVEKIETTTKNHLYRLSDRFFNGWLTFTQGGPHGERRVRDLALFLENLYNESGPADSIGQDHEDAEWIQGILKAGDFKGLEENLFDLGQQHHADLSVSLSHLLAHYQVTLVYRLFTAEKFGQRLINQYLPLYYACRLLMPDARTLSVKIPPELRDTVSKLLLSIYEKRDFYYQTNEAADFRARSLW